MIPASGGERQGTGDGAALPTSSQRGGHINPQAHLSLVLPSLSLLTRGWSVQCICPQGSHLLVNTRKNHI